MNDNIQEIEQMDALDRSLIRELGLQQEWRQKFALWDGQRNSLLQLRIRHIVADLASIAALFVVGLFVQALVPNTVINDHVSYLIETFTPSSSTTWGHNATTTPTDSLSCTDIYNK